MDEQIDQLLTTLDNVSDNENSAVNNENDESKEVVIKERDVKEPLPSNFITRWEWLYEYGECPLDVVVYLNDFDIWKENWMDEKDSPLNKWLWVYNKLKLNKSYNIKSAPIGVYPSDADFPIIVKPVLNLYGSGRGMLKFKTTEELSKFCRSELGCGMMWTPFFSGNHHSIDVVLVKGNIEYIVAFKGKQTDKMRLCEYDWWESDTDYKMPDKLKKWIKKSFKKKSIIDSDKNAFTGIIHLELIDDQLVECHLRMGIINVYGVYDCVCGNNSELTKSVINLYTKKEWTASVPKDLPKIYIVPLYVNYDDYNYIVNPEWETVSKIAKEKYDKVWMIQKCPPSTVSAHPIDLIKTWVIYSTSLEQSLKLREEIKELMHPKKVTYYITKTKEKLYGLSPLVFQSPFNIAIGAAVVICVFVIVQWFRHFFS